MSQRRWIATVVVSTVTMVTWSCSNTPKKPLYNFTTDARGSMATASQTWTLRAPENEPPIGIPSAAVLCAKDLYFADPRQSMVHHFDLDREMRVGLLDRRHKEVAEMGAPEALASDCSSDTLYVIDAKTIYQLDSETWSLKQKLQHPKSLGPALGAAVAFGDSIVLPGLYGGADWFRRDPATALRGAFIGHIARLDGQPSGPFVPALTERCRSLSFDCLRVGLDRQLADNAVTWAVCQSDSEVVAVYDSSLHKRSEINVTSPLFLSDGTSVDSAGSGIPSKIAWSQVNSTVYSCNMFGDLMVTVHTHLEPGEWSPGKAMAARVFLNVHNWKTGAQVVADVRLPDLPVAKDASGLYVLSLGSARASNGGHQLKLDRFEILNERGELNRLLF